MQHYTDAGQLKQGIEYLILVIGMLANSGIHLVIGRISTVVPYLRITGRLLTLPEYVLQKNERSAHGRAYALIFGYTHSPDNCRSSD